MAVVTGGDGWLWRRGTHRLCAELTAISQCVLYLVVHSICLAHAISLCARSAYVCIGGASQAGGKLFVSGLLAASHVFSKTSYMVKICRGAINLCMATRTLEPADASQEGSRAKQQLIFAVSVCPYQYVCVFQSPLVPLHQA